MMAIDLSIREGWIDELFGNTAWRFGSIRFTLPPSGMTQDQYLDAMAIDKKVVTVIKLVLLEALGKAVVTSDYQRTNLLQTLAINTAS